ncbi:aminotransferase-like [Striga asiatica]|uniref:Aminotransferase-like n=1 Tax=Striga asiatica TaxID=4170 RepID=A0A5A7QXS6_STRAF|nr:aminotransferase-like [Striga asiatica]
MNLGDVLENTWDFGLICKIIQKFFYGTLTSTFHSDIEHGHVGRTTQRDFFTWRSAAEGDLIHLGENLIHFLDEVLVLGMGFIGGEVAQSDCAAKNEDGDEVAEDRRCRICGSAFHGGGPRRGRRRLRWRWSSKARWRFALEPIGGKQ